MPYAHHDELEIHYTDEGGPGVPLVLGHAFNLDSREFDGLARRLAPAVRVIRWDARGFGRTRSPATPMHQVWQQHGPIPPLTEGMGQAVFGSAEHAQPWIERWRAMARDALREPLGALVGREDLSRYLPRLDVPALVVHGTDDVAVPFASGERMAAALPRASLVRIEGAGHSPVVTHEDVVAGEIRRFLAGL